MFAGNQASGITVDETIWGFDGQVVRHRFNLLSVLVNNSSAQPFEGEIRLQKSSGAGQAVDAVIVEPIYLAPYASRWVQLYPYVKQDWEDWELSWGRNSNERTSLARPRFGKPAAVILDDPGVVAPAGGALKRFPDNLFPPMVTATDGLKTLVFDHVPRWEEPRRQAFLDWLRRGGRVHILHGVNGRYPEFPTALAELNTPVDKQRIGAGVVFREPRGRREIDPEWIKEFVLGEADPTTRATGGRKDSVPVKPASQPDDGTPKDVVTQYGHPQSPFFRIEWEGDGVFLKALTLMSRPEHLWMLIHLLAWIYLGLLFPGCYVFGRSRPDYRIVFAVLLGVAIVFSATFAIIGRRGYNEASAVHAAAIAIPLGDGEYDILQWTNAFSIDGREYAFTHTGTGRIYSTAQDDEAVRGTIRMGNEASLSADLPPFSSRSFAHRAKVKAAPLGLKINSYALGAGDPTKQMTARNDAAAIERAVSVTMLRELEISVGAAFPEQPERIYALHGDYFYQMKRDDSQEGRLTLHGSVGSIENLMKLEEYTGYEFDWDPWDRKERTPEALFRRMFSPLIVRSLGIVDQKDLEAYKLPEDRVRVFVYAPMTPEFALKNDAFPVQHGYVLYCVDVFFPE